MKAESNIKPKNYEIENIQNDRCDVILYTNIQEIKEDENTRYTFDVYRLNICYNSNIHDEINNNYQRYLEIAKNKEYDVMAAEVRKKRNELLQNTDKEMCLDRMGIEIPENITASNLLVSVVNVFKGIRNILNNNTSKYRQELRDITKQEGFPYNVEWPKKEE